jgi:glutamyl/glutaminyl-tRNA synthetase
MARPAAHVIKRFPEYELAIERLLRQSESFRSMCDDYAVGVEALRRRERTTDPNNPARIAELRESLADLEEEMLEELEQEAAWRPDQRRRADRP